MEDFYFYAGVVALVILILMLTMIGITISYGTKLKVYPPYENACPDYWQANADTNYCNVPASTGTNIGNEFLVPNTNTPTDWADISNNLGGLLSGNNYSIKFAGNDASWNTIYPGMTVRCAKRKWAQDNGIVWDGISNYNGCK